MSDLRVRSARAAPPGQRPTWVEVDLAAISANVAALKAQAAAPRLMAVVKADGYGHGIAPAARAALSGGADWLAVALVEEGRALRDAGIDAQVLVLAEPPPAAAGALLDAGLVASVYTPAFTDALDAAAAERGTPAAVHVKLDTGMRRVGVPADDWEDALRRVRDAAWLRPVGLWSHFAVADEPDHPYIARQSAAFRRGLDLAAALGLRPELVHLCNSAGTLHLPDDHYDMVRPGLSVYGLEPAPGLASSTPLRPALTWYSRLALVKRVARGEPVSYGLRWSPERDTLVATVPAGYADGVTRALTNRGEVLVAGRRVPMVGTVTMDQLMIDLGPDGGAAGDEVCLIGSQDGERVTAEEWARLLGTISYEVVCTIGPRVPRVYVDGG
ncbi:MAG TPA: alanine racemase [Egibacteraceae bacterium]|nr:alanine racemase [Egibacteraceae bacterium]